MSQEITTREKALQAFEKALIKEKAGLMSEAVKYYRQAFKYDEKVVQYYREKNDALWKSAAGSSKSGEEPPTSLAPKQRLSSRLKKSQKLYADTNELLLSFADLSLEPEDPDTVCYLDKLPEEILTSIMEMLVLDNDCRAFISFALTCKKLAYVGFKRNDIWKLLCLIQYPQMAYHNPNLIDMFYDSDFTSSSDNAPAIHENQHLMIKNYENSWKNMYFERPFIKFRGIYISVCNYMSTGIKDYDSSSWTNPVHMVTYYRYFRFYPDGTCIRLLTIDEPSLVVPNFNIETKSGIRDVYLGKWKMTLNGRIMVESEGPVDKYRFYLLFQIRTAGKARHHKLNWISSYSVDKISQDKTYFSLKNDKSFSFVRVANYKYGFP